MSNVRNNAGIDVTKTTDQGFDLLDKLVATARPNAVFSQPVSSGDYTVITASEVLCGMGVGFGSGGSGDDQGLKSRHEFTAPDEGDEGLKSRHDLTPPAGYGSGGGGGGFSTGRPVAAISVGPDDVHVEPIVDVTKIGLAFFTTLGAMALMLARMSQFNRR